MAAINTKLRVQDRFSATFRRYNTGLREAARNQQQMNDNMQRGSLAADGLTGKIKNLAGAYLGLQGAAKLVNLSDEMTLTRARLNLITGDLEKTLALQEKIYAAAERSRGSYMDLQSVVGSLGNTAGDAFANTDEVIQFSENLSKMFKTSGMDSTGISSTMYNLTQSLSSGKLLGNDYRIIKQNAPQMVKYLEQYYDVSRAKLDEMVTAGQVSAQGIKNAMLAATDDINKKFDSMPMTWADVWQSIQNRFTRSVQPILDGISFMAQHWEQIEPIVWGVAGAVTAYLLISNAATIAEYAMAAATAVKNTVLLAAGIATYAYAAATGNATLAQYALNTAMSLSPIGLILTLIGIGIAFIYKWVKAVGGLRVAWQIVWNAIASFTGDIIGNILMKIQNFINKAIGLINLFISACNKVAGTSFEAISGVTFATQFQVDHEAANQRRAETLAKLQSNAGKDNSLNWQQMITNTGNTAASTAKTADAVSKTSEDLKWLRDIAERQAVNRFTTAEIKVDMGGIRNTVNSNMDLDGMVSYLEDTLTERMNAIAEGTHI